ncbi:MAG: hypothetical protein K8T90_03470 [Planctomycetes bacterium]|nr:hypothetical protein [Planctomycetota bacterium]
MSSIQRCRTCTREMVLEAYHAGRTVPCPWCRAENEVPKTLDFAALSQAQSKDETRGGTMLVLAVLGFILFCMPLGAWIWWSAHGTLGRAADEGRPGDGLVRAARWIAALGCIIQGVAIAVVIANTL